MGMFWHQPRLAERDHHAAGARLCPPVPHRSADLGARAQYLLAFTFQPVFGRPEQQLQAAVCEKQRG